GPLSPHDSLPDPPERTSSSETVREKILQHMRAELPFSTAVVVDKFDEEERERPPARAQDPRASARPRRGAAERPAKAGLLRLYCTIYVEHDSQKAIVIGRAGDMIKRIGTEARKDLEDTFETRVFLDLRVKVNPDWRHDDRALDDL